MCTLTWVREAESYSLYFNRDEQFSRPTATAPSAEFIDAVEVIIPIDPQAGGSWISVNAYGLTLAVLNRYDDPNGAKPVPPHPLAGSVSRGQLVRQLSSSASVQAVAETLSLFNQNVFVPYDLFAVGLEDAQHFHWNGEKMHQQPAAAFFASSGYDSSGVIAARQRLFDALPDRNADQLQAFHASHETSGAYGVCMHRSDAATQNYSSVQVTDTTVTMGFTAGAPCSETPVITALKRHHA